MNDTYKAHPVAATPFRWTEADATPYLPQNWQDELLSFTREHMEMHIIRYTPDNGTTREVSRNIHIPTLVVHGDIIKQGLPWLYEFYQTHARASMQSYFGQEKINCAEDMMYAINLQAAYDVDDHGISMRYECHVDWAPTAILYGTTQQPGDGGELVVSNDPEADSSTVENDCVKIFPAAGKLVCFDARRHPHYVATLKSKTVDILPPEQRPFRLAVVMLFCTDPTGSCPEASRPSSLDRHVGHIKPSPT